MNKINLEPEERHSRILVMYINNNIRQLKKRNELKTHPENTVDSHSLQLLRLLSAYHLGSTVDLHKIRDFVPGTTLGLRCLP